MGEKKTFFEKFSKYTPTDEARSILTNARNVGVRFNQEMRLVEADITLDVPVQKEALYRIEDAIRTCYQLNSMRILPHYPSETFTASYMSELMQELYRIGAVSRGFFDTQLPLLDQERKTILLTVPYAAGGVQLVNLAKTPQLLEQIIQSEFGLRYTVNVQQSEQYQWETYQKRMDQEALFLMQEAVQNAPPSSAGQSAAKEAELPKSTRVQTLFPNETSELTYLTDEEFTIGKMHFDTTEQKLIFGDVFPITPTPLRALDKECKAIVACGEVFAIEERVNFSGTKNTITFGITDRDSSIMVRAFLELEPAAELLSKLKNGQVVAVRGNVRRERDAKKNFTDELYLDPKAIMVIGKKERMDDAPEKRVELHIHSNMSTMDATIPPDVIVKTAARWGHKAVAITDHGTVQGFPEAMLAKEKLEKEKNLSVKILYGLEAYFVDDTARAVFGETQNGFHDEFVCFDIETTGFSSLHDAIIEIGAVLLKDGEVVDRFDTFVDPERPIPPKITELTHITDEMVQGAPKIAEALRAFFDFAKDRVLVAHNATFDTGFIRRAAELCEMPFENPYLDTLPLSRYVNPDLKRHTLDAVANHFGLGDFNHHRASDDAEMLALILAKMFEKLEQEGMRDLPQMIQVMSEHADPLKLPSYHQIILVKNLDGLKNLYKLISASYLQYYHRNPRIPKTLLTEMREGLIIGSACEAGELFRAMLDGKPESELERIAEFYDYLEIQPICNNRFLIADGKANSDEDLKDFNRRIVALGKKLGKPVCATCDAHFLNREDEIARKILLRGMKFSDGDRDVGLYYRTTEEMLAEFSYLGEDTAYEVVVTNPNRIADMVEDIRPIPKGTYTPKMEGAEEDLQNSCWNRAKEMYGDPLPEVVSKRLSRELDSIIKHGFAVLYMIAVKLVAYSESQGYLVGSRGSVGSSFVATMSGISEVNPLPPHYRCPKCKYSEFITDGSVGSGYDLPEKKCPKCGTDLLHDGHDIPFETFLGFYGDKSPDIDLNFSGDVQGKVHKYTEELFGKENVFRAGTIGTLASKTAYGYVMKYLEEKGISLNKAEVERLVEMCVGIRRTTGQHPGGIIVVPREYDVYQFTPIQHPADDPNSNIITTHFQFSYLHDTILKLDELGHDMPTKYKMLERYTNTSVLDVPMGDRDVYELFLSTKSIHCDLSAIGVKLGTLGLPEMGTHFIQGVLEDAQPKNFADLLQISGLTHGTDVWLGNAQDLIKEGICDISQVIGTRDGIMLDMLRYGVEDAISFKIMEDVRKGRGLKPEYEATMREHGVPDWYIASCKKIKYMFPKAHAAAYVMSAIRLGWYKVHRPLEFYAAFLTVAPSGFDSTIVLQGKNHVLDVIHEIENNKDATAKEKEMLNGLYLVYECYERGFQFLPVNLYHSAANAFLPESGKIRVPFTSLPGLGENAAVRIEEACKKEELFSVEELRERTGVSQAILDLLKENGALDGLSKTNQITFF